MKALLTVSSILAVLVLGDVQALTIHRSFGSRNVGFGRGTRVPVKLDGIGYRPDDGRERAGETRELRALTLCWDCERITA